jgi:hypothetical protein
MKHIIHKQVIELRLEKEKDAFRMEHLISGHYYNELVPLLETSFNDFCGESDVLIIDKLEIDLGFISEIDLEKSRWHDLLLATFKYNLRESLASIAAGKGVVRQSKEMNHCCQWLAYMQKGYLPWNVLEINDSWYSHVLETVATDYDAVASLRTIILHQPNVAVRISLQHDAFFLTKLVEILTAEKQEQLKVAAEEIYFLLGRLYGETGTQSSPEQVNIKTIWQQFLLAAATFRKNASTEVIAAIVIQPYVAMLPSNKQQQKTLLLQTPVLRKLIQRLFEEQDAKRAKKLISSEDEPSKQKKKKRNAGESKSAEENNDAWDGLQPQKNKPVNLADEDEIRAEDVIAFREQLNDTKDTNKADDVTITSSEVVPSSSAAVGSDIPSGSTINSRELSIDLTAAVETELKLVQAATNVATGKNEVNNTLMSDVVPSEGIFISHAGLVLTHPFLVFLFRRLQWMEGNRFISFESQVKAVFMLHYLATGETTAAEHELVFCKLMCAYPLKDPIPGAINFTMKETDESTDMLLAIIQQWSKLQNTSVAGLREGFLQRTGKLYMRNDEPCVIVEASAIDILLDFLPWNISLVKLPWMKEFLRIEWR